MSSLVALWMQSAARRRLAGLHDQFGTTGLLAAAAVPGLAAVVDQHCAAVRDILALGVEQSAAVSGAVLLAGYARGLLDQAAAQGARLAVPADTAAWVCADWLALRLLAVCALARTADDPRFHGGAGPAGPPQPAV